MSVIIPSIYVIVVPIAAFGLGYGYAKYRAWRKK